MATLLSKTRPYLSKVPAIIGLLSLANSTGAAVVRLDQLPLDSVMQDWGDPHANQSVDANAISLAGKTFEHGLGTHANSSWQLVLDGKAERFTAIVGVDDEVAREPQAKRLGVEFKITSENGVLWQSGRVSVGDAPKAVDVDLHGQKRLTLSVTSLGSSVDYGHVDWADAAINFSGAAPKPILHVQEPREVLTPPPAATPRINGASVFGVRPSHPLLFTIAATGDRPMSFAADGLPEGATLDTNTGRLTGAVAKAGTYTIAVHAKNARGTADRTLKLVVGDAIALTPPMGWNSWNCFAGTVSDEKIRSAADALVKSGLADHGWNYINIDDCWQVKETAPADQRRDAKGTILTNEKFPDMKALADYVHAKGLKVGIYSSPGPATCGGFEASYGHELGDAAQYAAWGFDYLKYDWCSYGRIADEKYRDRKDEASVHQMHEEPYDVMRDALRAQSRDIVFSLCQYGNNDVWKWGAQAGGKSWRTTGDIVDSWSSMSRIGFGQAALTEFAGPGHWNDPDMLVVGKDGWGGKLRDTRLTPNEQYTHVTLWSLLSAPLLIGCDLTQLDAFTLGLLTNDEVIAVSQDPLGHQARRVVRDEAHQTEIWTKDLEDGSQAVGLFNRGEKPATIVVKWTDLGLSGTQQTRDLWREKDVASDADGYKIEVARHGVALVKITPSK